MSKEYEVDFINCTEKECIQFCKKINNDEIDENKIKKTFDYFKNREYYRSNHFKEILLSSWYF